jgi:GGDEF domain-containing protein
VDTAKIAYYPGAQRAGQAQWSSGKRYLFNNTANRTLGLMYRPKKALPPEPFIVQCQESLPTNADITAALNQAQMSTGRPVEVRWVRPGTDSPMRLTCAYQQQGEPIWVLLEGPPRETREIWTYPCGDLSLILNLVISECTGVTAPAVETNNTASRINTSTTSAYSPSLLGLQATISSTRLTAVGAPAANKITAAATMEGALADMQVPNLLQSIALGKMTGRLFIDNTQTGGELFFIDGNLIHATAMDVRGEQAIVELVTWDKGKFYFYKDEKTAERTVEKRLDAILMESLTLLDQSKALMKAGFKMESYLSKKRPNLTEGEFDQLMKSGVPVDPALQKDFYLMVDGTSTLFDMLRKRPVTKQSWVPIMFNMFNADLIIIAQKSAKVDKTANLVSTAIDRTAIEQVIKSLIRPDTNILSYPSFHYFLEQEFLRYQLHSTPFSVIIFDMWVLKNNRYEPLPPEALKVAIGAVTAAKRSLDLFSHFETLSYALLLPHTEAAAAAILAFRILEMLRSRPLGPVDPQYLAIAFGIAALPEDSKDIGLLLSAAKVSKTAAQKSTSPVVMFKDMHGPQ